MVAVRALATMLAGIAAQQSMSAPVTGGRPVNGQPRAASGPPAR